MSLLPTWWNIASKLVQANMATVIVKSNCSSPPQPCLLQKQAGYHFPSWFISFLPGPAMMVHFLVLLSTTTGTLFLPLKHKSANSTTVKSTHLQEMWIQSKHKNEILFWEGLVLPTTCINEFYQGCSSFWCPLFPYPEVDALCWLPAG